MSSHNTRIEFTLFGLVLQPNWAASSWGFPRVEFPRDAQDGRLLPQPKRKASASPPAREQGQVRLAGVSLGVFSVLNNL